MTRLHHGFTVALSVFSESPFCLPSVAAFIMGQCEGFLTFVLKACLALDQGTSLVAAHLIALKYLSS